MGKGGENMAKTDKDEEAALYQRLAELGLIQPGMDERGAVGWINPLDLLKTKARARAKAETDGTNHNHGQKSRKRVRS